MPDFLSDNNACGQTILQIVSRGNAIIAEILRLKDYIPEVFLNGKSSKYHDIIFDFSYFKVVEIQEQKIETNNILHEIDNQFRNNHLEIISRFYSVFESIHMYIMDLNHYVDELEDGFYIQQSLEMIFTDLEGKQLLCEALYLYGVMLLLLDVHISGLIRERILVSYYRYTPQRRDTLSSFDDICKLLRDTGLTPQKRPNNYPEDYFKRVEIKDYYIEMVIGKLRSDDIYNQLSVYPLPRHRSTALANQAAMLYICLFFSTNILNNQSAVMREIVDKYFPDNWVISIYMGFTVNVFEFWEPFKAAKAALNNTLETNNIKSISNIVGDNVKNLLKTTGGLLKEGTISDDSMLQNINNIIVVLRECNVTIRWLMLHIILKNDKLEKLKRSKQLRELIVSETKYEPVQVFKLLLNTSALELLIKENIKQLLNDRDTTWDKLKTESYDLLTELSEVFGDKRNLMRVEKNTNLQKWFIEISKQIESLDQNKQTTAKIVQLIQALVEVQEFHQLDSNMQVVQYLNETRKCLHQMIRNLKINEDILINLQIIADVSYVWEIIDSYTPIMQNGIKNDPNLVIKLRAVFLKLASALETPLLRINQSHSDDLISVSQYYSSELEIYVRKVLQIIPKMMFDKMARIIQIQTSVLKELPAKLEKEKLREYAQLNERFEFAELTHSISVFSQGMRMMKSTLVGVICLDPKELLEDGIRKELVLHISKALHEELIFAGKTKSEDLELKLNSLGKIMDGYKRSFEYIQDYVNINGLKIWQEEVSRIINYNVEQECNGFLQYKIHAWDSKYQSRYVPIPHYPPSDANSVNFIGRLAREILHLTDSKNTLFLEQSLSWHDDTKNQKLIFNRQTISLLMSAIEVTGTIGLDRLFSFMIITNLKKILDILENKNNKYPNLLNTTSAIKNELKAINDETNIPKFYQNCISRVGKLYSQVLDLLLVIGQLQLLRKHIAFHINTEAKFDAKNLEAALRSLNKALIVDVGNPNNDNPSEELMDNLSHYFDYTGLNDAFDKIYITSKFNDNYAISLFLCTILYLPKMFLFGPKATGMSKKTYDFDGYPFIVGVHTLFKQFNPNLNKTYIENMCQYVMQLPKQQMSLSSGQMPHESVIAMKFLDSYKTLSRSSLNVFKANISDEIYYLYGIVSNCHY